MDHANLSDRVLLITGARGFIGTHLVNICSSEGIKYLKLSRKSKENELNEVLLSELPNCAIDVVVHLAGRAHVLSESASDPADAYYEANVVFTQKVAEAAVSAGVKRFIFVSTVGVYGLLHSESGVDETRQENPTELYAVTKLSAENWLRNYLAEQKVDLVILRPALVYGDGAPGNLARLYKLSALNFPLPLRNAVAPRTMLEVSSLCRAILLCSTDSRAVGQIFNVADEEGVSVSQIVECFRAGLGREKNLFALPAWCLKIVFKILGRTKMYRQLFMSFYLDNTKLKKLGWISVRDPLEKIKEIIAVRG